VFAESIACTNNRNSAGELVVWQAMRSYIQPTAYVLLLKSLMVLFNYLNFIVPVQGRNDSSLKWH